MDHQPLKFITKSNYHTRKLVRWVFILHENDFDKIHRVGKVNRDVNGLIYNISFNNEDTSKIHWHSKGNHVLNIHEDAIAIIYLQVGEIPIRLIPKECDQIVHRAK
ncbi:hypothetical protein BDL97_01G191300 [Sphagnum fallax]|nr:hypothetical protein BDL97_01G191300 [Sphagnum fallax]